MSAVNLKLTGAAELAKKLREMPIKLEKQSLQVSVLKALDEVLPEMIQAVPEHANEYSTNSKKYGTTKQNLRVVKIRQTGRNMKGARIDSGNAFWQIWYNLGSRHQPARPWFASKFRSLAQKIIDAFSQDVGQEIERLWAEK